MEDIRIFKGGRIDRAILYAASVLNESCDTLRGLFSQIIEDRIDILFPVKDLEQHTGWASRHGATITASSSAPAATWSRRA